MSGAGKMRRTESKIEIRIGKEHPRLYLVPKDKAHGIESLVSEYFVDKNESVTLDEAFSELNKKYSKHGNLVCGFRLKKGWTQAVLAKKIGTSQANIAAIENGKRKIGKNLAQKLADVFDTDYLVFLS